MRYTVYQTTTDPATLGTRTPGVAVTGTNTYYSDPWSCTEADGMGVTLRYTGTLTGTFTIWRTDVENPDLASDTDWVQDTAFNSSGSFAVSGAGKFADCAMNAKNRWWRFKYVNATNTGTIFGDVTVGRRA